MLILLQKPCQTTFSSPSMIQLQLVPMCPQVFPDEQMDQGLNINKGSLTPYPTPEYIRAVLLRALSAFSLRCSQDNKSGR